MHRIETFTPRPAVAYALLCFSAFLWASSTVVARGVHLDIPPAGLAFWRVTVAVLALAPIAVPELRRKWPLVRSLLPTLLFLGMLQVGALATMTLAVNYTTAINAVLVNASQPAITAVLAWALVRDRVTLPQSVGILLALAGIVVMVARAELEVILSMGFSIGDLVAVIAVVGWGLYAVRVPRVTHELGIGAMLFMVLLLGNLVLLPVHIAEHFFIRSTPFDWQMLLVVVVLGIFSTSLAIFIWMAGLRSVGPTRASIFLNLMPVFGAYLAIVFLDERLYAYHVVGALLVCAGISMVILKGRRHAAAE